MDRAAGTHPDVQKESMIGKLLLMFLIWTLFAVWAGGNLEAVIKWIKQKIEEARDWLRARNR